MFKTITFKQNFYYTLKTNFPGHNKIWGSKKVGGHYPLVPPPRGYVMCTCLVSCSDTRRKVRRRKFVVSQ